MGATLFNVSLDQNTINGFVNMAGDFVAGDEWIPLGTVMLDNSKTYTMTQESGAATFVSMRSAGVLFDFVPEPNSFSLLSLCGLAFVSLRRR
jgi:hypothetical protein